jgi:hypothetical protein
MSFGGANVPVLVGAVPLFYVSSMSITEGYRIERIARSRWSQAIAPTTKTIDIQAMLLGPERMILKKALEAEALASRALVAAAAPLLKSTGIPVVSGFTISLDMQITQLKFSQSNAKRDAIDVVLSLEYVPRSSLTAAIGEIADLALAAGSAFLPSVA